MEEDSFSSCCSSDSSKRLQIQLRGVFSCCCWLLLWSFFVPQEIGTPTSPPLPPPPYPPVLAPIYASLEIKPAQRQEWMYLINVIYSSVDLLRAMIMCLLRTKICFYFPNFHVFFTKTSKLVWRPMFVQTGWCWIVRQLKRQVFLPSDREKRGKRWPFAEALAKTQAGKYQQKENEVCRCAEMWFQTQITV